MGEKERNIRFAVCLDNDGYSASLELHKIYRVLPDEDAEANGDLRIVDETGEDYLYPAGQFASVNLPPEVGRSFLQRLT